METLISFPSSCLGTQESRQGINPQAESQSSLKAAIILSPFSKQPPPLSPLFKKGGGRDVSSKSGHSSAAWE